MSDDIAGQMQDDLRKEFGLDEQRRPSVCTIASFLLVSVTTALIITIVVTGLSVIFHPSEMTQVLGKYVYITVLATALVAVIVSGIIGEVNGLKKRFHGRNGK